MAGDSPLAAFRRANGWSQEQLAAKLGIRSKGYISRVEGGHETCSLKIALRIQKLSAGALPARVLRPTDPDLQPADAEMSA